MSYLTITIKVILIVIKIKFYDKHRRLYTYGGYKTGGLVDESSTMIVRPTRSSSSYKGHYRTKIIIIKLNKIALLDLFRITHQITTGAQHSRFTIFCIYCSFTISFECINRKRISYLSIWVLGMVSRELNQWQPETKTTWVQLIKHRMITKMLLCIEMTYCLNLWLTHWNKWDHI